MEIVTSENTQIEPQYKEGRVLLLDDERLVRFTISAWLNKSGYEVVVAASPEEALTALSKTRFEAVISDVVMTPMDGFMFRTALRQFNARIPILFLTAQINDASNNLMLRITEDTYSFYIPKSSRRDYLLSRLRMAIRAYRSDKEVLSLKAEMAHNLHLASFVQRAMLPRWANYRTYGFYSTFWRSHSVVSGDLFEYYPLTEHSSFMVFGDISGHGVPAALAMTAVQSYLKQLAILGDGQARYPHLICKEIDRFIHENLRDIAYMPGIVMYLNFKENIVRYCNAGSIEPLYFSRTDGQYVNVNPESRGAMPMGLVEGAQYSESDVVEVKVTEDSILCMMSDGFVDLSQDEAGEERVPQELFQQLLSELVQAANGTSDIGSIPYRLYGLLKDLGYCYPQDDMSLVLIGHTARHSGRFLSEVGVRRAQSIDSVVQRAGAWVKEHFANDEFQVKVELLLNEHLENIYRHGLDDYGRRHEVIVLEMRQAGEGLEVVTWDRGTSWVVDSTADASETEAHLDERNRMLAGNGRGLDILRKVAETISYETIEGLNRTTFFLKPETLVAAEIPSLEEVLSSL